MLKSMTGYGKSVLEFENKKFNIEIKSLNSKQIDINFKSPSIFKEKELEIRKLINELHRGKIDFYITLENNNIENNGKINKIVFEDYYNQIKEIGNNLNLQVNEQVFDSILRFPDIFTHKQTTIDETEWLAIKTSIISAIDNLNKFRNQEGEVLQKDIEKRIKNILLLLQDIDLPEQQRIKKIKDRIHSNIEIFLNKKNIDENRFEQELIFYLEKIDITEEKIRLKNHCNYFIETIKTNNPIGKKLGFISQEIGREINTLGSKANDSNLQKIVILMKDELEKIKEQILNIL